MEAPRARVARVVQDELSRVLLVEPTRVTDQTQLTQELGIESIDWMDILYGLEQALGVKLGAGPVFLDPQFYDPASGYVSGGGLTPAGLKALESCAGLDVSRLAGAQALEYLRSAGALIDHLTSLAPAGG